MGETAEGAHQRFAAAVLAGLSDPVIIIDSVGNVVHANEATERVLGWRAEERVGTSVMDVVHPADRQLAALSLTSMGSKETGTAIEVRVATADGSWRHLEVIGSNMLDDPIVGGIVLVARDLNERHRWEVAGGDEPLFRLVVQHSSAITMLLGADGRIASASGALTGLLRHDPERVAGQHLSALVTDADCSAVTQALVVAAGSLEPTIVEASFPRPFGDGEVDLELTIVNLVADPVVAGFIVTGHDIGARKAAEAAVVDSQRQLAEAQRLARLGSWEWDIASGSITWSPQLLELFDVDDASYPRDYEAYLNAVHPDDRATVDEAVRAAFESHESFEVDHRVVTRTGGVRWLHGRGSVIVDGTVPVRMVGTCIDVTERMQLQQELKALALIDPLTGLHNRRGFLITAEQELRLARRLNLSAALVYADLDNLKKINDTYGHHEGDRALREIGDLISRTFRESDIKARLGGDEYAVFLIDADPSNAHASVERLRAALDHVNRSNDYAYDLSLSIGVVVTEAGSSVEAMLAEADNAMYADKQTRRRRPRILVVEDDRSLGDLLVEHLGATFDVTSAHDLSQATHALSAHRFDIVLMDRNLPDSRGTPTLTRLRQAARGANFMVMTADGNEPEADSLRSGAADFIAKPFDLEVLDARLARLLTPQSRNVR